LPTDPFQARQEEKVKDQTKCKLCQAVRGLDPETVLLYWKAMHNKRIFALTIVEVLADFGIKTSETTIVNHRAKSDQGSGASRDKCYRIMSEYVSAL